jgi:uncharacterized protein YbaP (TraB family)
VAAVGPGRADPAIWRVAGAHASVYLVGSAPTAPADGRWKTPALLRAAAASQEIWFVTPFGLPGPLSAIRMVAVIQTEGYLPSGQTLSSLLSADGRSRLARLAATEGVALAKLDRMAPWNADITLTLAARRRDGSAKGLPVETFVLENAPAHAPRRGLDTLEQDLRLFIATPQKEQVYLLEEAMKRIDDPSLNRRYGEAWAAGDAAWIEREREASLQQNAPVTYQTMQIGPRRRWAAQVDKLAHGERTAILVLDAANLVGPDGLPAMLRRQGAAVEGPAAVAGPR